MFMEYEDRIQKAVDLFMEGYSCSQSVVAAFADLYGVEDNTAKLISAGFGGGVGRLRMMCGAVSGLVILAGLDSGTTDAGDSHAKGDCYGLVRQLLAEFNKRNGSLICAELLSMNGCKVVKDTNVPDERNAQYYKVRPCAAKVESAARIFAEYLCDKHK